MHVEDKGKGKTVPWVAYTNKRLLSVTLCEETGAQVENGYCPVHGGDACMYVYSHPYRRKEYELD